MSILGGGYTLLPQVYPTPSPERTWDQRYPIPGRDIGPEIPYTLRTTEAAGTHPIGMLSCCWKFIQLDGNLVVYSEVSVNVSPSECQSPREGVT